MPTKEVKNTAERNVASEKLSDISVSFPEDKMRALEFYLKEHDRTPQDELGNYLNTMFLRAVPEEVRRFNFPDADEIEDNALFAGAEAKRIPRTTRTPEQKAALNEKRRLEREAAKQAAQGENPTVPGEAPAEPGQEAPAEPQGLTELK